MTPAEWRGMPRQRAIRWTSEPDMLAWVRGNDRGGDRFEVARGFAAEFGFWPTASQLGQARARLGINVGTKRASRKGRPVGSERLGKDGYAYVKVAERPTVPMSGDNWRPKQVVVWERANGRALPPHHVIMFADGDKGNFDPDNLVAVPRRLLGPLNQRRRLWRDRETLEAAIALCELASAVRDARRGARECMVCGRTFEPTASQRYGNPRTCPDCVAAGRKWRGVRYGGEAATCEACGREYVRYGKNQYRCHECSERNLGRHK